MLGRAPPTLTQPPKTPRCCESWEAELGFCFCSRGNATFSFVVSLLKQRAGCLLFLGTPASFLILGVISPAMLHHHIFPCPSQLHPSVTLPFLPQKGLWWVMFFFPHSEKKS